MGNRYSEIGADPFDGAHAACLFHLCATGAKSTTDELQCEAPSSFLLRLATRACRIGTFAHGRCLVVVRSLSSSSRT